jgi:hypothetical protein
MVSKSTFATFSLATSSQSYFLRPDRILAAYHLDHSKPLQLEGSTIAQLTEEKANEESVKKLLQAEDERTRGNLLRAELALASGWARSNDNQAAAALAEVKRRISIRKLESSITVNELTRGQVSTPVSPISGKRRFFVEDEPGSTI